MKKLINKKNTYLLVLLVICLLGIVIVPTYAKFGSNYTTTDDVVGMSLTFNLAITNIEEYEEIVVAAGEVEQFNVEVTNSAGNTAYYGVWYQMVVPSEITSDIVIARFVDSTVTTSGSITNGSSVTVSLIIKNKTSSDIRVNIGVGSSLTGTSDIEYLGGKYLITDVVSLTDPVALNTMSAGSYVSYTGNNGCSGSACSGQNANYVSDSDMGYCPSPYSELSKFTVNGWRILYLKDSTAYLIRAGAPECMSTNSSGTISSSLSSDYESTAGAPKHLANLDARALKYCNAEYAYGGVCNSSSAWSVDSTEFKNITGTNISECTTSSSSCGIGNTLLDIGGFYWFADVPYSTDPYVFMWTPAITEMSSSPQINGYYSKYALGVRPVLRLKSTVMVVGGSGTYQDPYVLSSS